MIEQNVRVVRCHDERLWVSLGSQSGCSACDNGRGCGAGLFAKLFQRKPVVIELPRNGQYVKAGQMMTLALPEQLYVRLVLASYGWPLIAALAGGVIGNSLATWLHLNSLPSDLTTLAAGLLAAGVVIKLVRHTQLTGLFRDCQQSMDYYPATEAGMCSRKSSESVDDDE